VNDNESDHTFRAPRYIYRVETGEPFTYLVSVRNNGPLPIRLLGLPAPDLPLDERLVQSESAWTGLGLLRDPAVVSADPHDVVPFQPVDLAPGEEIVVVVAEMGGACADPALSPPRPADPNQYTISGIAFVYEMLATRDTVFMSLPFENTVPSTPGCVPDAF
jgi:hypothetical protein